MINTKSKDKAEELIEKFYQTSPQVTARYEDGRPGRKVFDKAKKNAGICVDEIMGALNVAMGAQVFLYWEEVKKYISEHE